MQLTSLHARHRECLTSVAAIHSLFKSFERVHQLQVHLVPPPPPPINSCLLTTTCDGQRSMLLLQMKNIKRSTVTYLTL
jgi:hypothetical protein